MHVCVSVCVDCPGLDGDGGKGGGLTEISSKRITDHASLAYWFRAKNTHTYTQNLPLPCAFYLAASLSHRDILYFTHIRCGWVSSSMASLSVHWDEENSCFLFRAEYRKTEKRDDANVKIRHTCASSKHLVRKKKTENRKECWDMFKDQYRRSILRSTDGNS